MFTKRLGEASDGEEFGFKAAAISGMKNAGIHIPDGFVVSSSALESFLNSNNLRSKLNEIRVERSPSGFRQAEYRIRQLFADSPMPSDIRNDVLEAYNEMAVSNELKSAEAAFSLIKAGREQQLVAVRPSVVRQPENSFAGVLDSFINVIGEEDIIRHIKLCWASLFYPYAAAYMERRSIPDTGMGVIVQKMAESEKSGTLMTEFGGNKMLMEASWGNGKTVCSGMVTPDEYLLDSEGALIEKNISKKLWKLFRNEMTGVTERVHVPGSHMDAQVLTDAEMKKVCDACMAVNPAGGQMLIDWCIGRGRVSILDAKPAGYEITQEMDTQAAGNILVTGRFVSKGTASGDVIMPDNPSSVSSDGMIAVIKDSSVRLMLSVPGISGIVADEGGRLSNMGIMARELGIPALTATQNATNVLKEGERVRLIAQHGKVVAESIQDAGVSEQQNAFSQQIFNDTLPHAPSGTSSGYHGAKIYVKAAMEAIESADNPDGVIAYYVPAQPGALLAQKTGTQHPVWISPVNQEEISRASEDAKRMLENGRQDIGVFVPVIKGDEAEKNRYYLPAGVKTGVSIKTPAMALLSADFISEGISAVNIELASLTQLTMGLGRPEANIHDSVLELIGKVHNACMTSGAECIVSISNEYTNDWNLEKLLKAGIKSFCVEPEMLHDVKGSIERVYSTPPGNTGNGMEEPAFGSENQASEGVSPFDFSPSSFS